MYMYLHFLTAGKPNIWSMDQVAAIRSAPVKKDNSEIIFLISQGKHIL